MERENAGNLITNELWDFVGGNSMKSETKTNLSHKFWSEAINTANYIRNRLPSKSLKGKTPHDFGRELHRVYLLNDI